jgi:hypothetical protein
MEIKIILLYGDRLVKITSLSSDEKKTLKDYIDESIVLNNIEKEKYFLYLNSVDVLKYVNIDDETTEIFINPTHPNLKTLHTTNYNYCKIFNDDEDVIVRFANNLLYLDHGKLLYNLCILHTEYYKSKVRTECPICYNKTLCFKFFKCNHVICNDCYLQMKKIKCALCRSN